MVQQQQKPVQKPPPKEEVQQPPPVQTPKAPTPEVEKPPSEPEIMKAPEQKPEDKTEMSEEKNKDKEKVHSEHSEKKEAAPGHISSHDESDYEDNITVTVPPAHMQSHGPPRTYNGNSRKSRGEGSYYVSSKR